MESRRSLRRARTIPRFSRRSRPRRRRVRGFRRPTIAASSPTLPSGDAGARARRGRRALRGDATICSGASAPMPASSMPATPPIRRAANSTATCRRSSPRPPTHLLFFELELNRLDDGALERGDGRRPARRITGRGSKTSARQALPARGPRRAAVPRKIGDGLRRLEPAVRRDHRRAALQGRWARRWPSSRRSICCRTRTKDAQGGGRGARRDASRTICAQFTLITNTLAKDKEISDRWRGFADVADSRHLSNRVEREVVDALVARRARRLSAPVAPLLHAQGQMVRQEAAAEIWDRNAPLPQRAAPHLSAGTEARRHGARRLWRVLAENGRHRRAVFRPSAGSMRRCGPARRPAPSRIRPCRRRIPMCCSIIRASRAT